MDDLVPALRSSLSTEENDAISDLDCSKFLVARKGNINGAIKLAHDWCKWRNSEILGCPGLTPNNIIVKTIDNNIGTHPSKHLLPFALHGEDKEGRPIYWEKSGVISSLFHKSKAIWNIDQLVSFYIRNMELTTLRCQHYSRLRGTLVYQRVMVYDLTGLNLVPDMMAINTVRRDLTISQAFYPEGLYRMYLVNAPFFFTGIWALISPFIDPDTAKKIQILGTNFLPVLQEHIPLSQIPVELGGTAVVPWCGPWAEESGVSDAQVRSHFGLPPAEGSVPPAVVESDVAAFALLRDETVDITDDVAPGEDESAIALSQAPVAMAIE